MPVCIPVPSSKRPRRSLTRFYGKTQHAVKLIVLPRPAFTIPRSRTDKPKRFNGRRSLGGNGLSRSSSRQSGVSRGRSSVSPPGTTRSRAFLSAEDAKDCRRYWSREGSRSPSPAYDGSQDSLRTRFHGSDAESSRDGTVQSGGNRRLRAQRSSGLYGDSVRTRTISEPTKGTPAAVQPKPGRAVSQPVPASSSRHLTAHDNISYQSGVSGAMTAKLLTPIIEDADHFGELVYSSFGSSSGVKASIPPPERYDSLIDEVQFVPREPKVEFPRKVSNDYSPPTEVGQSLKSSASASASISVHIGNHSATLGDLESLPSFVLTIPTPVLDRSPFFPESFSMQSFVAPAEPGLSSSPTTTSSRRLSSTPPLPRFHAPSPAGELCTCEECEMQMFPRGTWSQDPDGGQPERGAQHEPQPDNSTVIAAAVMDMLGLPAPSRPSTPLTLSRAQAQGLGLALGDGRASARSRKTQPKWTPPGTDGCTGDPDAYADERDAFLPRTNLGALPGSPNGKIWNRLAGLVRRRRGRSDQADARRARNSGVTRASFLDLDSRRNRR
ncbi:hypothetical protein OF83DRAFT_808828 [Amylostereum chailletii]|nr:hypothetical protein OF83DRAFT_808828 [Amylostereum chailletii]